MTQGSGGGGADHVRPGGRPRASELRRAGTILGGLHRSATWAGSLIVVAVSWGDNARRRDPGASRRARELRTSGRHERLRLGRAAGAGDSSAAPERPRPGAEHRHRHPGERRAAIGGSSSASTAGSPPLHRWMCATHNQGAGTTAANSVTSTAAATTAANGDLIFGVAMDDFGELPAPSIPGTGVYAARYPQRHGHAATEDAIRCAAGPVAARSHSSRARHLSRAADGGAQGQVQRRRWPAVPSISENLPARHRQPDRPGTVDAPPQSA